MSANSELLGGASMCCSSTHPALARVVATHHLTPALLLHSVPATMSSWRPFFLFLVATEHSFAWMAHCLFRLLPHLGYPLGLAAQRCCTEVLMHVSPLLCAIMSVGQIPSTGIAGVEGVSQFSSGSCGKACHPHFSSHQAVILRG